VKDYLLAGLMDSHLLAFSPSFSRATFTSAPRTNTNFDIAGTGGNLIRDFVSDCDGVHKYGLMIKQLRPT
jgi:hypothetical protein